MCYINRLYILTIYSAGLNHCPTFIDQKLLKRQKTAVSPKYFFHGLDHGMLITTVQWLQLNFLLLNNLGGYIKRKTVFQGVCGVLQSNMESLEPALNGWDKKWIKMINLFLEYQMKVFLQFQNLFTAKALCSFWRGCLTLKFLEYFNLRLATQLFPTGFICTKSEPHQGYHYNTDIKYTILLTSGLKPMLSPIVYVAGFSNNKKIIKGYVISLNGWSGLSPGSK